MKFAVIITIFIVANTCHGTSLRFKDGKYFPSKELSSTAAIEEIRNLVKWNSGIHLGFNKSVNPFQNLLKSRNQIHPESKKSANPTSADELTTFIRLEHGGSLLGKLMTSRAARNYAAFLGVPYAKPALGEMRFRSPVPADPWGGVLIVTELKPECRQKDRVVDVVIGSEDCLYLNIYTPKTNLDANLPVMFYIHGGGPYESGSRYGADYFMDEDVVLVTFNYRLGIFGNLNTYNDDARGNQGLKDQVTALRWVNEHIENFGGNKSKITIFGNSYGSMGVTTHLMSPMSTGLFQRAICQSGDQIMPSLTTKTPLDNAIVLAQQLNCNWNSTKDISTCFRNTDSDSLVLKSHNMSFGTTAELPTPTFEETFLPDMPLKLLRGGNLNKASIMFGAASAEGLGFSLPVLMSPELTSFFNNFWEVAATEALLLRETPELKDPERIANAARQFYFGSALIGRANEPNFTAMFSDRTFVHTAHVSADIHLQNAREHQTGDDFYLYYFNKESEVSNADPFIDEYGEGFLGASHADELQYMFPYKHAFHEFPYISTDSAHFNFSRMLIRLWVTFANTGVPSGAYNDVKWEAMTQKPYRWFKLDEEPQMIDTLGDRMAFWDSFNVTDLYI